MEFLALYQRSTSRTDGDDPGRQSACASQQVVIVGMYPRTDGSFNACRKQRAGEESSTCVHVQTYTHTQRKKERESTYDQHTEWEDGVAAIISHFLA